MIHLTQKSKDDHTHIDKGDVVVTLCEQHVPFTTAQADCVRHAINLLAVANQNI